MTTQDIIEAILRQTPGRSYCDGCIRDIIRASSMDDVRHALTIIKRQSGFLAQEALCSGCGQYKSTVSPR
jgi:hypothetical protein